MSQRRTPLIEPGSVGKRTCEQVCQQCLIAWLLFWCCLPVRAEEQSQEVGPLFVRVNAPQAAGLSERVEIGITVRSPEHTVCALQDLKVGDDLGGALVLSVSKQGPDRFEGQFGTLLLSTWSIQIEPLAEGPLKLKPLAVRYRSGEEKEWQTGKVAIPVVEIRAEYAASAEDELRPLPDLYSEPKPVSAAQWMRWIGAGILAIAGILALVWITGSKKASPRKRALEALRRIEQDASKEPRDRARSACDEIRQYLEQVYHLGASHQTTPEFLSDPQTNRQLPEEQRTALAEFLAEADVEKFATDEPSEPQWRRCLAQARAFLASEPE